LGDSFVQSGHFREAKSIFERLAPVADRGPRARIMLARCQSAMGEYDACSKTLDSAFGREESIASDLHSALVFLTLGFRDDAIKALLELAKRNTSLPTVCLVLGDAFAKQGDVKRAKACWQMAISRDRLKGGVTIAAGRRLKADNV
jgi:lipopolysaccharide biosynthesis regulator YciM